MIPDRDFIKDPDVPGPTKEDLRCLVMCKAQPTHSDRALEVGCGTGGLTVELSRRVREVYALDKNPDAIEVTRKNLEKFGHQERVELIEGDASALIPGFPSCQILIVGGSSGDLPQILEKGLEKLDPDGRIVVTSILLETRIQALDTLKNMGLKPEVMEVFVARGEHISAGTMMKAHNPVAIVWAKKTI